MAVIQSKLRPPPAPEHFVERPRLEQLLAALVERHRVVVVSATAGAGKTTAVIGALGRLERPVAWLTVDRTDVLPGRLVTYLEAALARVEPALDGIVRRALGAGIPHPEAAGLLAEAAGGNGFVVVLDELERLEKEPNAWSVIESFIRYTSDDTRIVLVSRRDIPSSLCGWRELTAAIGEVDLAFTMAEAAEALDLLGAVGVDPAEAVEATGGWVTGILFEAWRLNDHVAGAGGEADPLYGYLSSHILEGLEPEDCDFLVSSSLLDEVSAARATRLGLRNAGERLAALRAAHLPVSWLSNATVMRCHSRFREYLLKQLERRDDEDVAALHRAYGQLLTAEGHHEEAVEELLAAGAPDEALIAAEHAILSVVERLEFEVTGRWLETFGTIAPAGASPLTIAELMVAAAQDDFRRCVRICDQLEALGEREQLARLSERAAGLMALAYIIYGRLDDADAVLSVAEQGPDVEAARYVFRLFSDEAPQGSDAAQMSGGPLDSIVLTTKYLSGRLSELESDAPSRWLESVMRPWRIAGLRATGRTQDALELYESARNTVLNPMSLEALVGPHVLLDAGRHDEARHALERGRRLAHASGSPGYQLEMELSAAKLALKIDGDTKTARAALARLRQMESFTTFAYVREIADTWEGLALLLDSEDAAARKCLRRAVRSMQRADRILELPTAAVYLAEAEWRRGEEHAADRAADVALEAAGRQGSNHLLLQALAGFPAVVSRRIDAEAAATSPWHELGRALIAQGLRIEARVRVSVQLHEFGQAVVLVNGERRDPGISKSHELLSFLASCPGAHASRGELLEALFDGRTDESSRSYLRQAVRRLRAILPDDGTLISESAGVRLSDDVALTSESGRFETQLAEAARLQGEERLAVTLDALAIFDHGEFLPQTRSAWADERRRVLGDLAIDARYEVAEIAFTAGRYDEARQLGESVLKADPFREGAWRLLMRVAGALGDERGVIAAYEGCERALRDVAATPTDATRQLLGNLRR